MKDNVLPWRSQQRLEKVREEAAPQTRKELEEMISKELNKLEEKKNGTAARKQAEMERKALERAQKEAIVGAYEGKRGRRPDIYYWAKYTLPFRMEYEDHDRDMGKTRVRIWDENFRTIDDFLVPNAEHLGKELFKKHLEHALGIQHAIQRELRRMGLPDPTEKDDEENLDEQGV